VGIDDKSPAVIFERLKIRHFDWFKGGSIKGHLPSVAEENIF